MAIQGAPLASQLLSAARGVGFNTGLPRCARNDSTRKSAIDFQIQYQNKLDTPSRTRCGNERFFQASNVIWVAPARSLR